MEIKINIQATGLEKAINNLATALGGAPMGQVKVQTEKQIEKTQGDVENNSKETSKETELKLEDVRVKLAEISQKGKQKEIKELIKSFGVGKLSDIPSEKYAELLEKAEAL